MPADIELSPELNPYSLPLPGGIIHQEFGPFKRLFQNHVDHVTNLLERCKPLMGCWLPPLIAPRSNATEPGQFSIILASAFGHQGGALFVFAGQELQLSSPMNFHPVFTRLAAEVRNRMNPPHKTVLLGMWMDLTTQTGKTPLETLETLNPAQPPAEEQKEDYEI